MKILLVDDEAIVLKGISVMLRDAHPEWTVIGSCASAEEALSLMERHLPDVVISDIRMFEMSGIELAQRIHQEHPQVLVILLTGYADFEYAQQAVKLHVFDYLLKPAKKESIQECLLRAQEKLLINSQNREQAQRLHEQASQDLPQLREKFLRDITHGLLPLGGDVGRELERYHLLAPKYHALCCALLGDAPKEARAGEMTVSFKEGWEKAAMPLGELIAFGEQPWQLGCVWMLGEGQTASEDTLKRCATDFSQALFGVSDRVCLGLGNEVDNVEALFDSYHQAEYALQAAQKQNLPLVVFAGMEQPCATISSDQVKCAVAYIDEHFQKEISLKDVAKAVFLNPWYLSELFKKQVGTTFSGYVQDKRLQHACKLLVKSNLKLYEVAYQSGFGDQAYFSALFKKAYGMPPKKYREENAGKSGI